MKQHRKRMQAKLEVHFILRNRTSKLQSWLNPWTALIARENPKDSLIHRTDITVTYSLNKQNKYKLATTNSGTGFAVPEISQN